MTQGIRNKILSVLIEPSTITDLKNKIPEVKSFGTLVYHLNLLENEGKITKKHKEKKGDKILYKLTDAKIIKVFEEMEKRDKKYLIAFLKMIKSNPHIEDSILLNKLEQEGFDSNLMNDIFSNSISRHFSVIQHKITPRGLKFLEDNSNNT